jgi:hypothetical protein
MRSRTSSWLPGIKWPSTSKVVWIFEWPVNAGKNACVRGSP